MLEQVIGSYRLLAKLGEGGMGVVYLAEHSLIGKHAAIKVLLPQYSHNSDIVNRFFNEARSTTQIRHPGLVDIYDFGYAPDGSAYIIMEYLQGESLASLLARYRPFPFEAIVRIGRQIAAAVGAAHRAGIVHRDLKPDNAFIIADEQIAGGQRVKILDFGIAKLAGPGNETNTNKTQVGSVLGTPTYMSPEQCKGSPTIDYRADIYSLGCMLYEMAVGRVPFWSDAPGEMLAHHLFSPVTPPRAIDPNIDWYLEALIMRMLDKAPENRPQSMEQVDAELERIGSAHGQVTQPQIATMALSPLGEPIPGRVQAVGTQPPAASTLNVPKKRSKAPMFVIAGLVGVIVAVAAVLATSTGGPAATPGTPGVVTGPGGPAAPGTTQPGAQPGQAGNPAGASGPRFKVGQETGFDLPSGPGVAGAPGVPGAPTTLARPVEPPPSGIFGRFNAALSTVGTRVLRATEGDFKFEPGYIRVKVRSRPPGAQVFYDAQLVGKTPLVLDFEESTQDLKFKVSLAGYEDMEAVVTGDADHRIFAPLVRIPVKIEVTILSTPAGAAVHHGDKVLGQTPLKLDLMSHEEPLQVVLRLEGHREQPLTVPREATATLSTKLESLCKRKNSGARRPRLIDPYDPCREK